MLPLGRLPAELLATIFVLLDRSSDADQDRVSVMCCCKHWHHVALQTPDLWATIRMRHTKKDDNPDTCSVESHVQNSLSRAGTAPLLIILDEPYTLHHPKCSLTALIAQADRWHSFTLIGSQTFISAITNGADFKNLVHLSITSGGDNSVVMNSSGRIHLSRLRSLKLEIGEISRPPSLVAPLLAELDVTVSLISDKNFLVAIICSSPLLVSIRVSNWRTTGHSAAPCAMPTFVRLRGVSINNPLWLLTVSKPIIHSSPLLKELGLGVHHLIGREPLLDPLPQIETVTFYFGVPMPQHPAFRPYPTARTPDRKHNARKWLELFPRASTVRIVDEKEGYRQVNPEVAVLTDALFLLKLPSPEHSVLFSDLQHLIFENVKIDFALKKLHRFTKRRTWVQDGGGLKPGSSKPEDPDTDCRVTVKNCGDIGSIERASLRELEEYLRRTERRKIGITSPASSLV